MEHVQHPPTWWFRLLAWLWPSRCREIPHPRQPTWPDGSPRILLRQFSIRLGHWYLQQFACNEDEKLHSHPYRFMIALGLWGGYLEERAAGRPRRKSAPYFYTMDDTVTHHVRDVRPGHTALFLGFGRAPDGDDADKHYFARPSDSLPALLKEAADYINATDDDGHWHELEDRLREAAATPQASRVLWKDHIVKFVKRI